MKRPLWLPAILILFACAASAETQCGIDTQTVAARIDIAPASLPPENMLPSISGILPGCSMEPFNPPSRNSPPVRVGMDSEEKDSTGVSPWSFNIRVNSATDRSA
jgi:hypothetical protein